MPDTLRLACAVTALALSIVPDAAAFAPAPTKESKGDPLPKDASARLGSVRLRHAGEVISLAFSPDGKTLLAGGREGDKAVYLWDATDGKRRFRVPMDSGCAVAYSPDGKRVAVVTHEVGKDNRVIVLDAATGKELHRLETHAEVGCFCFCPKGGQLALLAGGINAREELLLWEPGRKPRRFERLGGWGTVVAVSPDGKLIAGRCAFSTPIRVWDAASGKQIHLLQGHEDAVLALAFTSDGRRLVSAGQGEKNAVRIWDLGTGKELPALPDRKGDVKAMWLSADDKTLLVVDGEARLRGWRLPEGKRLDRLPKLDAPAGYSVVAAFSPDGKRLAMGQTPVIALWDLSNGSRLLRQPGHEADVTDLSFSADGKRLASCAADGVILWDLRDRRSLGRFGSREERPKAAALSSDGSLLAFSGECEERKVRLFDADKGKELTVIMWEAKRERDSRRYERQEVGWMRFSPDGRSLAVAVDGKARLWRLNTGREVQGDPLVLQGEGRGFWPGGFSRDGKTFLAATEGGVMHWATSDGKRKSEAGGKVSGRTSAVALSPDGKVLAVGSDSDELVLRDAKTGKELAQLVKASGESSWHFRALAFSPDGKILASGENTGVIRFWDVKSRKELARHEGHVGRVQSLAFSPDGKTLASGGADTTVLLWPVPALKD
jgi:WD40 repeat protein